MVLYDSDSSNVLFVQYILNFLFRLLRFQYLFKIRQQNRYNEGS